MRGSYWIRSGTRPVRNVPSSIAGNPKLQGSQTLERQPSVPKAVAMVARPRLPLVGLPAQVEGELGDEQIVHPLLEARAELGGQRLEQGHRILSHLAKREHLGVEPQ